MMAMPMLEIGKAHEFLRAHFDIDVSDDDALIAQYMLAQVSLEHLKPEFREMGAEVASKIILHSNGVLEKAHASIVDVGNQVASMHDAMKATIEAAERAERLNAMLDDKTAEMRAASDEMRAMLDGKLAALDDKMTALDERLDRTSGLAHKMTEMADKTVQAVVALTQGLLSIKKKGFWSR